MKKTAATCILFGVFLATPSTLSCQEQQKQNEARLVAAINEFSLDLYPRLATEAKDICVSPASIATALLMANVGARGGTGAEMDKVLCLGGSKTDTGEKPTRLHGEARCSAVAALLDRLNPPANKALEKPKPAKARDRARFHRGIPAELRVVNAMWGQDGYPFSVEYVATLKKSYRAAVGHVDFRKDRAAASHAINAWVEEATKDKIQKLVSPDVLVPTTRLVLTNAVYFKGAWVHHFWDKATKPAAFCLEGAEPVRVPTMHQTEDHAYFTDDALQILEMRYIGDSQAMVILLPKKDQKLAAFEKTLTAGRLRELIGKLETRCVEIALPKFKITSSLSLAKCLADMGMPSAFDPERADFSGINDGQEPLWISDVLHKTYIDVDEKGTEAAAATAVMALGGAMPTKPVSFQADRPFLFLIRDIRTGLILFMGRVIDPRSAS